ncbi:MAG: thioredoxin [Blastocatellia bacterium]|nr:thioredoxin [Blastocatellia bacterium]
MTVKPITTRQFETEVLQAPLPVLVDFYAPWCGPCQMLSPVLDRLAEEFAGSVTFVKINLDTNQDLASALRIRSVPTLFFFKDGAIVDMVAGLQSPQVLRQKLAVLATGGSPARNWGGRML